MPGLMLAFACPCGYRTHDVMAGATQSGHHRVVLCDTCHRIFSLWRDREEDDPASSHACPACGQQVRGGRPLACRECGKPLIDVTAPGAWGPPALQERFPDREPWMIDSSDFDPEPPENEPWNEQEAEETPEERIALLETIRIRCPRCHNCSLTFQEEGCWD
jgi:DNA-directed RNA polymerase subunit RPC12/RpoP